MEARQLRIGNLIEIPTFGDNLKDEIFKGFGYSVIMANSLIISDAERLGDNYAGRPVPLTEQWLIDLGFKNAIGMNNNNFLLLTTGSVEFQFDEVGLLLSIEGQCLQLSHIKYVHQLQNLYFALTGQELTYNQKTLSK